MSAKNRLTFGFLSEYRNFLMGFAMISIILHHYTEDCSKMNVHYLPGSWEQLYQHYISSAGVDAFIFFSGFGLYFSLKHRYELKAFFKKRFIKILIPFFLVAAPYNFQKYLLFGHAGIKAMLSSLFFIDFFKEGSTSYWYILLILVCYLIYPGVFRLVDGAGSKKQEYLRVLVLCLFTTGITVLLMIFAPDKYDQWNIALARFPLFFTGCLAGKYAYRKERFSSAALFILVLALPVMLIFREGAGALLRRYLLAYTFMSISIFTALLMYLIRDKLPHLHEAAMRFLGFFGTFSLELYLTHVTVRNLFNNHGFHTCYGRNELLMVLISILLSVFLHAVSEKISGLMIRK